MARRLGDNPDAVSEGGPTQGGSGGAAQSAISRAIATTAGAPSISPVTQPGRPPQCAWDEALLASGQRVGDAQIGDALIVLNADGDGYVPHAIAAIRPGFEPCVRLVSESGITLTCSTTTPITTRDEGGAFIVVPAPDSFGIEVPVLDAHGFRWERIRTVEPRGELPVRLLSCGGATYAAGDVPGRWMFTHNIKVPGGEEI